MDQDGFFLWRGWVSPAEDESVGDEHAILYGGPADAEGTGIGGYEVFRGKSDREKGELLLMNFSDFTSVSCARIAAGCQEDPTPTP